MSLLAGSDSSSFHKEPALLPSPTLLYGHSSNETWLSSADLSTLWNRSSACCGKRDHQRFYFFHFVVFSPHDHVLMRRVLFQQQRLVSHICSTCCCHVWFQVEAWPTSSWWWQCTEQNHCNVLETWSTGDDRHMFKCFLFSIHTLSTGLTYHPAGAKLLSFPDIPLWLTDRAFRSHMRSCGKLGYPYSLSLPLSSVVLKKS